VIRNSNETDYSKSLFPLRQKYLPCGTNAKHRQQTVNCWILWIR